MKINFSAAAAAILAAVTLTACGGSNPPKASYKSDVKTALVNPDALEKHLGEYPDLEGSGPHLRFNKTTARPGEYAEVTMSVANADMQWNMCGIHIVYPDVLEPEISNPEEHYVWYKKGDALENSTGAVCIQWHNKLPDLLQEKRLGCTFFTCMFEGNSGLDGEIMKFHLKVPEDAKSGTVYNIGCYYADTDLFKCAENIPSFQKYAFQHFTGGTITVE